ncbi:MAG TPA: hypothetical protein VEK15_23300 [Vicinamibacteria bacterium]|nr:hypothetical protein [Vicinamibacteria bacterium]
MSNGLFRAAGESYRKALELAPDDTYIRRNYELFKKGAEERTR